MASLYRGTTLSKDLVRIAFWLYVRQTMGKRFYTDPFLVLAGPEGLDIFCLLALGKSADSIVAVDKDPMHLAEVRKRYPQVKAGNVFDIAEEYRPGFFGCVFLDFCDSLTDDLILQCARLIRCSIIPQGIFGVVVKAAREHGLIGKIIQARNETQRLQGNHKPRAFGRTDELLEKITAYLSRYDYGLRYGSSWTYQSKGLKDGKKTNGSPMLLCTGEFSLYPWRLPQETPIPQKVDPDIKGVREYALEWMDQYPEVPTRALALMLGCPVQRLAGWKAAQTKRNQTAV